MKQCARTSGPWSRNHVNGAGPVVELQYHRLYRQWSVVEYGELKIKEGRYKQERASTRRGRYLGYMRWVEDIEKDKKGSW